MFQKLFQKFGYLLSFIYPKAIRDKINNMKVGINSGWIKRYFKECGTNCTFGVFLLLKGAKYIKIGNNVTIGNKVVLEVYDFYEPTNQHFYPELSIGNDCTFGDFGHISCINGVIIGNGVRCGKKVFITDNAHGISERSLMNIRPNLRPLSSKGKVVIDDNVWIGEMVCIMPGVHVGHGVIIGANAVVTHDIPPLCVVGGNPARIIKQL